uniref:TIL domain-containing protein n=1 Tax=Amblyomma maculatum TaxID=34609 RepID=G3MRQ1_AMBMU
MKALRIALAVLVLEACEVFAHPEGGVGVSEASLPSCGPGEVFKECESTSCGELSCADPEPTDECSRDCAYQCFCVRGLYRNSLGICVPFSQCERRPVTKA